MLIRGYCRGLCWQVLNCKIGKLQGELMAVCQMETGTDAVRCVREMYGLPYKNKLLDVKYMVGSPVK